MITSSNRQLGLFCFLLTMIVFTFTLWQIYGPLRSYRSRILQTIMSKIVTNQTDYSRLINLVDFKFRIFENVCRNYSDPFLLMMVASTPDHFHRRKIIRETWGQNVSRVKIVFLLGAVQDEEVELERELILENVKYRDLLQGNFLDAYKNLTYKHVMGLKYVIYHCPKARYVLKADDDAFVNTYALLDFLRSGQFPLDLTFCSKMVYSPALRDPKSKWYVTYEEFPEEFYPPYCSGYAVVYSSSVVSKLYKSAQRNKYFWVDDAHVSGVLAKINNLSITDASQYVMHGNDVVNITKGSAVRRKFFFGYNLSEEKMEKLWKYLCC